jgi:hypothetical protein
MAACGMQAVLSRLNADPFVGERPQGGDENGQASPLASRSLRQFASQPFARSSPPPIAFSPAALRYLSARITVLTGYAGPDSQVNLRPTRHRRNRIWLEFDQDGCPRWHWCLLL